MTETQREQFFELAGRLYNDGMTWPQADVKAEEAMMILHPELNVSDFNQVLAVQPQEKRQ